MGIDAELIILVGAVILFISIIVSKVSSRFGVPTLLLFLIVGMLFGTDGLGIEFSSMKTAQFIGIIALSIILFTGGMDTKITDIRPILVPGIVLATLGVGLTALFTGVFIFFLSKSMLASISVSFAFALMMASTMSSTDSASVFNVLRSQKIGLKYHMKPLLELESGSNDPMAFMLTTTLIGVIQLETNNQGWIMVLLLFLIQFAVGLLAGFLFGKGSVWLINKIKLQNVSLYPILLLAIIFITFTVTDFAFGNGYLAVYIAGIYIGNHPLVKKHETAKFMDGMTWLFQIIMFLVLGLLVNPREMLHVAPFALLVGIFMIVVARPLSVYLCLIPFKKMPFKAKTFASWVGLRGAVPIIFATYPAVAGIPGSQELFNIVFFITIVSLLVQGTTIPKVAKLLGIATRYRKEGNDFGIEIPEELDSKLWDVDVTADMLVKGNQLKEMKLPEGILVILIKRGEDYIVPNGSVEIKEKDKLLLISSKDHDEPHLLQPQL